MVMSFEKGQSLQDIISERKTLNGNELLKIAFKLLDGLKVVHESGFIHRDIKPGNIYIREDGNPVLLDFGSARQALTAESKSVTSIVSKGYAPLEQYQSTTSDLGPWTDIYSLGATLYRCSTGVVPVDPPSRSNAILRKRKDPLVPTRDILGDSYSEEFCIAVDHALSLQHEDRPRTVDDWTKDFSGANKNTVNTESELITEINEINNNIINRARNKLTRYKYHVLGLAVSIFTMFMITFYGLNTHNQELELAVKKYNDTNYYEALPLLKNLSDKNNVRAEFLLAMMYMQGYAVEYDDELALNILGKIDPEIKKAADNGEIWARTNLGIMYLFGLSVEKNQELALKLTREAAHHNFARAIDNLAYFYANGVVVSQDQNEANKLYMKASREGLVLADIEIARRYANGIGFISDRKKAEQIYIDAIKKGSDLAKLELAKIYYAGMEEEKDYEKGYKLLSDVAERNYPFAYYFLGYIYENGIGVEINEKEALNWYMRGAENGHILSMSRIAVFYNDGIGTEQDKRKSISWHEKAAIKGNPFSQSMLATAYYIGHEKTKDVNKAIEWFNKSASQGDMYSQYMLGLIYYEDGEYPDNMAESIKYFELAAEQGYADAQSRLGNIYSNGIGVAQDDARAIQYYKAAYENGNISAQVAYAYFLLTGRGTQKNLNQAYKLYLDAAEKGDMDAQMYAGNMYKDGIGVSQDIEKAIEWYKKSASQNYQPAIDILEEINQQKRKHYALDKFKYLEGKYSGLWQSSVYGSMGEAELDIKITDNQLKGALKTDSSSYRGDDFIGNIKSVNNVGVTIEFSGLNTAMNIMAIYKDNNLKGNYHLLDNDEDDKGTFEFNK